MLAWSFLIDDVKSSKLLVVRVLLYLKLEWFFFGFFQTAAIHDIGVPWPEKTIALSLENYSNVL